MGVLFLAGCSGGSSDDSVWPELDSLKSIKAGDITSISYIRSTEDGVSEGSITEPGEIEDVYLRLCNIEVLSETEDSVVDDGLDITVATADKELTFSFAGDTLLGDEISYEVENIDSLRSYIDKMIEEQADDGGESGAVSNGGSGGTDDYDIMEGMMTESSSDGSIEYIHFNDFTLTMPNNELWGWEQTDKNSVTIYHFGARQEGYGGELVTIMALDMNDTSYENYPNYHIAGAGKNSGRRLIAVYPTDVRFDTNNENMIAEYQDLLHYLQKIGDGAADSPLQTADSD